MKMARRVLALLLLVPMLLAAAPQPQGSLTLTSTTPVTFTAQTSNLRNGSHLWVSMHCYPASGDVYYGEELADANGNYVMDDTVWVLWSGTVAEGQCRAFLIYRFDSQSGKTSTGEVVLYDTGWFTAP